MERTKKPDAQVTGQEAPEQEAPEQKAPEQETPEQEAPEQEVPGQETPGQETPEQEAPEQEAPEQEPPEQETPKQKTEAIPPLQYAVNAEHGLNLRQSPDLDAPIVAVLPCSVGVFDSGFIQNGWMEVFTGKLTGWVKAKYLEPIWD